MEQKNKIIMEKSVIFFLTTVCLFIACKSDNHEIENPEKPDIKRLESVDSAKIMLVEFYTEYTNLLLNNKTKLDDDIYLLFSSFLTKGLLDKIYDPELDYDPFIDAQDYDDSILKTMTISKNADTQNSYIYCYKAFYETEICISLTTIKENGEYYIDEIIE